MSYNDYLLIGSIWGDTFVATLEPICGEGGIRTRETLLAFTHFPGVPLQPLEHLSFPQISLRVVP